MKGAEIGVYGAALGYQGAFKKDVPTSS
jgi:hypothetical protein